MNDAVTDPDDPDAEWISTELDRLFADERLDLRPMPGAVQRIVTGAQRRRRRRTVFATGGATAAVSVLVAAGLVFGGGVLPGDPSEESRTVPAGSSSRSTSVPVAAPVTPGLLEREVASEGESTAPRRSLTHSPPARSTVLSSIDPPPRGSIATTEPVLGPDGYQALTLGMPRQDALETGMLAEHEYVSPEHNGCEHYRLAEGAAAIEEVTVSGTRGVVGFRASAAQTAQGIAPGSSASRLHETYPELTVEHGWYAVPTSAGHYLFRTAAGTVTEMWLVSTDPACWPRTNE